MAGNTRGKLKEHFEGIHRNFDWSIHHINTALVLIDTQIRATNSEQEKQQTEDELVDFIQKHPLYVGIKALGEGIQTLDILAQQVYEKL